MLIGEVTSLSTVLENIGSVFTALIGYVSSICETIIANPILLVGFAIPFAFAIVSFVKRLF